MLNTSEKKYSIACVTGASGMIGRRITQKLLDLGYKVRVLTRSSYYNPNVEIFHASFENDAEIDKFICGADMVFHCAAELADESKIYESNVLGTEKVVRLIGKYKVSYYCHLSSAGVVGDTNEKWVNENILCSPNDFYGITKLEAEKIAGRNIEGCNTIILRPTTVVDEDHLGQLSLAVYDSIINRLKVFLEVPSVRT